MKAYILTLIFCLSAPLAAFAQREASDSISLRCDSLAKTVNIGGFVKPDSLTSDFRLPYQYAHESTQLFNYIDSKPLDLNIPDFTFDPGEASIFRWTNGEVMASGASVVYPGLMQIDSGTLGIFQRFGNFDFYGG